MRTKFVKTMMHQIGNAVYSAFVKEYLADGQDAVLAHQNATSMTDTAQVLIAESWVSLGIASDWRTAVDEEPDGLTTEQRLRKLLRGDFGNEG